MTLSYTPLRHKMLAELATKAIMRVSGRDVSQTGFRRRENRSRLASAESRTVGVLLGVHAAFPSGHLGPSVGAPQLIELTPSGRSLLSSWDTQYGEVEP